MRIDSEFAVTVPPEEAFELLTDVHRLVPCMPGAELTETLDDGTFRGRATVKLGPMTLTFAGDARFVEVDETSRTAQIAASGRDQRGRGMARADITSRVTAGDGETRVLVTTDLKLSGAVAQFGRQGIVSDVAENLIGQFARCLNAQLDGSTAQAGEAVEQAGRGISAFGMLRVALASALRRLRERVRRLRRPGR